MQLRQKVILSIFHSQYLAVPAEKEIQVYERDNWNLAFSLTDDCIKEVRTVVDPLIY